MIICHPLKIIFLKTKKTAGTSFEIALSKYCDDTCIITPVSPTDEELRQERGGRAGQNYEEQTWPDGTRSTARFYNHIPAWEVKALVPDEIWSSYRKISIIRDPYDAAISRYWWEGGDKTGLTFAQFCDRYRMYLNESGVIAPSEGDCAADHILRYEHLEEDVIALGVDGLWDELSAIRAKSTQRPKKGAGIAETYQANPGTVDIVAEECADIIVRFGYKAPASVATSEAGGQTPQQIFTLTGGRTPIAWLSQLIGDNLGIPSKHESIRPEDIGTAMPDVRTMRMFNTYGMTTHVRDFWHRKLDRLASPMADLDHTYAKGGLIEALAERPLRDTATVVILRRDLVEQCAGHLVHGDFNNPTIEWQWFLAPEYSNSIVQSEPFLPLGAAGRAIWYCFEMEARIAYYQLLFKGQIRFVEASSGSVATPEGATELLQKLGYSGEISLPEVMDETGVDAGTWESMKQEVGQLINQIAFDPVQLASAYINKGRRLSQPPRG